MKTSQILAAAALALFAVAGAQAEIYEGVRTATSTKSREEVHAEAARTASAPNQNVIHIQDDGESEERRIPRGQATQLRDVSTSFAWPLFSFSNPEGPLHLHGDGARSLLGLNVHVHRVPHARDHFSIGARAGGHVLIGSAGGANGLGLNNRTILRSGDRFRAARTASLSRFHVQQEVDNFWSTEK